MAEGIGGIDAQVSDVSDRYRNNIPALENRTKENKGIIDIIALQRVVAGQKREADRISMGLETDPNTIGAQLQAKALEGEKAKMGRTLGELTKNTADTSQAAGIMQKQKMNARMAGKPTTQGIAGLNGVGLLGGKATQLAKVDPRTAGIASGERTMSLKAGGIIGYKEGRGVAPTGSYNLSGLTMGSPATDALLKATKADGTKKYTLDQVKRYVKVVARAAAEGLDYVPNHLIAPSAQEEIGEVIGAPRNLTPADKTSLASGLDGDQSGMDTETGSGFNLKPITAKLDEVPVDPDITARNDETALARASAEATSLDFPVAAPPATTGEVTYTPTAVNPQDFFPSNLGEVDATLSNADTDPSVVAATDALASSTTDMNAAAGKTPDSKVFTDIAAPVVPELRNIDNAYNANEQGIAAALQASNTKDANLDYEQMGKTARADNDSFLRRSENADDFRRMRSAEVDLQSQLFSPSDMAADQRIAVGAGAAKGPGGMARAGLDNRRLQRKDLTANLNTLNQFDRDRIAQDSATGINSSLIGSQAATRARSTRSEGIAGLQGILDSSQERSMQDQDLRSAVNRDVYNAETSFATADYKEQGKALQRNWGSLQSVVANNRSALTSAVNVMRSNTAEQNKIKVANANQRVKKAEAQAKIAFDENKMYLESSDKLQELLSQSQAKGAEILQKVMFEDQSASQIMSALRQMSESENPTEVRNLKAELEAITKFYTVQLASIAPVLFAEQNILRDAIAQREAKTRLPPKQFSPGQIQTAVPRP